MAKEINNAPTAADRTLRDVAMYAAVLAQQAKQQQFDAPATAEEIAAAPSWLRHLEGYE